MSSRSPTRNIEETSPKRSEPIPISPSFRRRSASISSSSSASTSSGSGSELPTPLSGSNSSNRVSIPSPGSSPLLSYFLAQSPTAKGPGAGTFPLSKRFNVNPPVFEEVDEEVPVAAHARRASASVAGRFGQAQSSVIPDSRQERGTGLLRRLSLSSTAFVRPDPQSLAAPPNTAVSPVMKDPPPFAAREGRSRRSATLSVEKPRRAPSPMGERILKGHFDGFN